MVNSKFKRGWLMQSPISQPVHPTCLKCNEPLTVEVILTRQVIADSLTVARVWFVSENSVCDYGAYLLQ